MRRYVNLSDVPLSMAVWLATDSYDHDDKCISATALIKPVRQLILAKRVPPTEALSDVIDLVSSRMGTAIHDGIEGSWLRNYKIAMASLGYPAKVIERIRINPDPDNIPEGCIPIFMEIRSYREVMGYRISGKLDFLMDGQVEDFKSTSVNSWVNNNKDEDYILQGSIYRWLNPKLITRDTMQINFLFTDWSGMMARTNPKYPPKRLMSKKFNLMSLQQTEAYIVDRLNQFQRYGRAKEEDIPLCSDKELWRSEPSWKYYKDPEKRTRSTKNFDNKAEAYTRHSADGSVGIVVEVPGQVRACKYCAGFNACKQKDALIASGDLII